MKVGETIHRYNSSLVRVSEDVVVKQIRHGHEHWSAQELFENEVNALQMFSGVMGFQQIVEHKALTISSKYCGENINKKEILNIKSIDEQKSEILNTLKSKRALHRDFHPENLLILDGVITIIDFTWCIYPGSIFEKDKRIPVGLGLEYKDPSGYNDEYSFNKCLEGLK